MKAVPRSLAAGAAFALLALCAALTVRANAAEETFFSLRQSWEDTREWSRKLGLSVSGAASDLETLGAGIPGGNLAPRALSGRSRKNYRAREGQSLLGAQILSFDRAVYQEEGARLGELASYPDTRMRTPWDNRTPYVSISAAYNLGGVFEGLGAWIPAEPLLDDAASTLGLGLPFGRDVTFTTEARFGKNLGPKRGAAASVRTGVGWKW